MNRAHVIVSFLILSLCLLFHGSPSSAAKEVEPNTLPEQANLMRVGEAMSGMFEDSFDHFRVNLPGPGRVTVTLSGCPGGGNVQLGAKDFGYTGWEESNGRGTVSLTFEARSTNGLIWIKPTFYGSVCGDAWCVARFSPNGPYTVTKRAPKIPGSLEGVSIQPELYYQLTVSHQAVGAAGPVPTTGGQPPAAKPGTVTPPVAGPTQPVGGQPPAARPGTVPPPATNPATPAGGTTPAAGVKLFQENHFRFAFELPASMSAELLPDKGGYMITAPAGSELGELVFVVQAVSKSANPGSSVNKQLKEARRLLKRHPGADIHSEDARRVAGQKTEYFVVSYPALDSKQKKTQFKHMQLVLENGPNYYWVSFSAPNKEFKKHKEIFFHMLNTFRFI